MDLVIAYAIPVFAVSILAELTRTRRQGKRTYEFKDTVASIGVGIGAAIVGLPFRFMFLWVLTIVYQYRLFTIELSWVGYLLLLFGEDCCYYWSHRINHEVRLFWAGHVNHHSSRHYHLVTAIRQSWTQPFLMWIFWLPLPLLGFSPEMILLQQSISLVYQFFIHTEEIKTLGVLEWFMNTPSHHRVHHAVNPRYLDRNHAGIFIIWDRLFGTFAQERADDPPVYGITKNIETFNVFRIAFHEWAAMLCDVANAPSLLSKLKYVFAPPGYSHDGRSKTAAQIRTQVLLSSPAE